MTVGLSEAARSGIDGSVRNTGAHMDGSRDSLEGGSHEAVSHSVHKKPGHRDTRRAPPPALPVDSRNPPIARLNTDEEKSPTHAQHMQGQKALKEPEQQERAGLGLDEMMHQAKEGEGHERMSVKEGGEVDSKEPEAGEAVDKDDSRKGVREDEVKEGTQLHADPVAAAEAAREQVREARLRAV